MINLIHLNTVMDAFHSATKSIFTWVGSKYLCMQTSEKAGGLRVGHISNIESQ